MRERELDSKREVAAHRYGEVLDTHENMNRQSHSESHARNLDEALAVLGVDDALTGEKQLTKCACACGDVWVGVVGA